MGRAMNVEREVSLIRCDDVMVEPTDDHHPWHDGTHGAEWAMVSHDVCTNAP